MQIQLEKTVDVEVVERQLAELWKQTTGESESSADTAVLRARVANLLVFIASDALLDDAQQMMQELTATHPSRVLLMLGNREATDRDIEMYVASFFHSEKRGGARRLSCEQITLKAQGRFCGELPSAALPLLIPDLSTFLWWRDALHISDKVFEILVRRTDRLVIDSAEFRDPPAELVETDKLFATGDWKPLGVSDLNWARLTLWRLLLADFYDVPAYQPLLDQVDYVRIDYVGPEFATAAVAPQALLIAGWLASRLGWELSDEQPFQEKDEMIAFKFSSGERGSSPTIREGAADRAITLELHRVERAERKPGRLARVELRSNVGEAASFMVTRNADNLHIVAEAILGPDTHRGRVLPVRNRSAAQLLSREMEILCNDDVYE
ncbi:MAG: glucose-6-phosphate dehydrogenase assembly protein OpcA, partial [Acidobacteriota bacterium]|nr:glucose-6-phosphate dehydrogenase assembly protein OpcA [Acidobacteriota bacterium]